MAFILLKLAFRTPKQEAFITPKRSILNAYILAFLTPKLAFNFYEMDPWYLTKIEVWSLIAV